MDHLEIAKNLDAERIPIIAQTVDLLMQDWLLMELFPTIGRERYILDMEINYAALVKTVRYRSPMMMDDHVRWRRTMLLDHACSTGMVRQGYAHMWTAISAHMPVETLPVIYDYVAAGMNTLAYSDANAEQIAAAHEQLAEDLVASSYDVHWHWQAAYGDEGRARALHDAWFAIDYLVDAFGTRRDGLFGQHIHWLRARLWQRNLTTTHMQQWLWLLGQAAEQRLAPQVAAYTHRLLEHANSGLRHESETCHALLAAQNTLVAEVTQQLVAQGLAAEPEQAALEAGWYVAYLSDGVARRDPAGLLAYTQWMQHWFAAQGLPDTPLRQSYVALSQALERHLPHYVAHEALSIVRAAQTAL